MAYPKRLKKSLRFDKAKEKKAKSQLFICRCPKSGKHLEKAPETHIPKPFYFRTLRPFPSEEGRARPISGTSS